MATVKAELGFPSITIVDMTPQWSSDIEALITQAANIIEDGQVIDTINPVTEGWKFIDHIGSLFLGAPFAGGRVQRLTKAEFGG